MPCPSGMLVTETFTVSPASAKFVVFETVTISGETALAGDDIAPLITSATAVTPEARDLINLFMITFSFLLIGIFGYLLFKLQRNDDVGLTIC